MPPRLLHLSLAVLGLALVGGAVPATAPAAVSAASVSSGRAHSCAVLSGGSVACWGEDKHGQLGNGSTSPERSSPVAVIGLAGATGVSAGSNHTCAVLGGGGVDCWGGGAEGELGNGKVSQTSTRDDADSHTPVAVSGITNATAVSAGPNHTCALLSGGTVKCWGIGSFGVLGYGSMANRSTPVAVSGITTAVQVSAGGYNTCAVLADGRVECWGDNSSGQLGTGGTGASATPVVVNGVANAVAVSAGIYHVCALLQGGSIECWGAGQQGQLGNGVTANSSAPVAVSGITNATSVSAGGYHTCALLADGSVDCWGEGQSGKLGNGLTASSSTPVAVSGLSDARSIGAGSDHTCAVLSAGGVACWGSGASGDLGNGSDADSATPVTVLPFPLPAPVFGRTINVEPVSGVVLIEVAGSSTFVPLTTAVTVPLGSTIDTTDGKVKLTSARDRASHIQSGLFDSGVFGTSQFARGALAGITVLTLTGALDCAAARRAAGGQGKSTVRQLWGVSHGKFRTKGRFAAATVRGTRWNVKDTCAGTLVTVASGAVTVNDFVHRQTFVLRAPHSVLIRPGGEAKQSIRSFIASIEKLLATLKQGRTRLSKALGGAAACSTSLHAAGAQVESVIQNRTAIRAGLEHESAPNAAASRAIARLRTALDHSLAADRHYRTWLADLESSHAGCPLPQNQAFNAAHREDVKATAAKRQFVRAFNPIARKQHRRVWRADEF